MTLYFKNCFSTLIQLIALGLIAATVSAEEIDEIIVSADFRDATLLKTAASITVLDRKTITARQARHLEQLLNLAPNVNFASGASRGRFVQIRGVGERSQFVEPLNPSVGILVDGIDFTGIAGAATTLDIQQVEVLRGPQGTLYGANALAGMINLKSNRPTDHLQGNFALGMGSYNSRNISAALGGPLTNWLGYRFAVQKNNSDGFIKNDFLNRDNTNNIDELSVRTRFDWQASQDLSLGLSLFYVDVDNGYDGFSLDNTRHTLSDHPGHDRHRVTAVAINSLWQGAKTFDLVSAFSLADNNLEYGYDEDWAFADICSGEPCAGWEYSSVDNYIRQRDYISADIKMLSKGVPTVLGYSAEWTVGIYWRDQQEGLLRQYTFADAAFTSDFDTFNSAIYGQLDSQLSKAVRLSTGLRYESRRAKYHDNDTVNHNANENLWGGRLSLQYQISENNHLYGLLSRGYKAGGVNSSPELSEQDREFDTELMWNFEIGIKSLWCNDSLQTNISTFYQLREDIQIKQSLVQPIEDSNATSFTDYFGNAAEGKNYGLEVEFNWSVSGSVAFNGSVGLLKSYYEVPLSENLDHREQAHAPSYQFAFGTNVQLTDNVEFGLQIEGKDKFFLSSRHNAKTSSYELLNANLRYSSDQLELSLWGRNLTDKDVIVRGFGSFGNDPRKFYATEPYYQFGEPRVLGVSASLQF